MIRRRIGGPASIAGPLLHSGILGMVALAAALGLVLPRLALAVDWIPPPRVTALIPSATIAPGASRTMTLTVRANGSASNLTWIATSGGSFTVGVAPASGVLTIPPNGIASVPLTVTVPALAIGSSSLSIDLVADPGGARVAKVGASVQAATDGRPEVLPVPSTWSATSGSSGSVSFQLRSTIGSAETVLLTAGRVQPDPNNAGGIFSGATPPASVSLPAGGTVTVNVPTTIAARAYAGTATAVQLSVTSAGGIGNGVGLALSSASLPDSLPTALVPVGVTPFGTAATGRDGPVLLASRGVWLVPCGDEGVRVIRQTSIDSIGMIDADGDGDDDRVVGTIRIPGFAAALSVVPGFVAASGDTLDLGLLAAGNEGFMLLDLRMVEDPPFGTWSDFFDSDGNGIDDRILRVLPTSGFATDAGWVSAPSGRHVALIADADVGSVPVSASYDPALITAGTGAGVLAVDLEAAVDSLGPVPYAAGTLPTQGSALDLEVRGRAAPEMALADGSGGVAFFGLTVGSGAPATIAFTPRGEVPLSGMWGAPHARDLAWIPNTGDSAYVALAADAGGMQIIRAPRGASPPALVLAQQTVAPAVGIASAWTGTLGVAMRSGGVALLRVPAAAELDKIQPGAPAPYTQPVNLSRVQSWGMAGALERALHGSWVTSATALRFRDTPGSLPDLIVSDGERLLVLRTGTASVTGVAETAVAPPAVPAIRAMPNPTSGALWLELSRSGASPAAGVRISIVDAAGRRVRTLRASGAGTLLRVAWDGRDDRGRPAASGRYWARLEERQGFRAPATPITLIR